MLAHLRTPESVYERRWWTLVVLCLSLVIVIVGNTVLNVALPTLVRDLHATSSELQWIVDAYALVFAGLLLTGGALGDRYGRKGCLTIGLMIYGSAAVASTLATQPVHLIITRALMGVGAALIMPATLSILTNVFPPHELGKAIGIWAGLAGAGGAIGPIAGGWLLEHFGWPSIFVANVPVIVIALVAGALLVPTSRDPERAPLDPLGAVLSTLALGSLLYAVIESPERGWTDGRTLTALLGGIALVAGFITWELRTPYPMLNVRFYRNPRFTAANIAIVLTFFSMFGSFFALTQYLQFVRGYTPLQAGFRLLPFAGMMMLTAPNSDRLVRRLGTKVVVASGLVMVAIALFLMSFVTRETSYVQLIGVFVLMGVGFGLVMPPSTASIMGSLPPGKAGVGSAVNDVTREMGGAVGVAVLGSLLASGYRSGVAAVAAHLPPPAASAVRSGVGGALAVAQSVGGPTGARVADAATRAFVHGMGRGFVTASVIALVGAAIVVRFLPARAPDVSHQAEPREGTPAPAAVVGAAKP
jgi:EmrB/QacA subfamily drug resistance transporter